ncbi:DNA-binding transcriptional repressor [Rhodobacterales bacterium HTCC2150]|nr:DNA-binding transcriptional repressor [Rhodobacterales bacterium HTCC2150] [Rhodobacteraceae bacterium HTCC2150]
MSQNNILFTQTDCLDEFACCFVVIKSIYFDNALILVKFLSLCCFAFFFWFFPLWCRMHLAHPRNGRDMGHSEQLKSDSFQKFDLGFPWANPKWSFWNLTRFQSWFFAGTELRFPDLSRPNRNEIFP